MVVRDEPAFIESGPAPRHSLRSNAASDGYAEATRLRCPTCRFDLPAAPAE